VYALAHGYGPLEDFRQRLQVAWRASRRRVWINRYGYLTEEKIDAIGSVVNDLMKTDSQLEASIERFQRGFWNRQTVDRLPSGWSPTGSGRDRLSARTASEALSGARRRQPR